MTKYPAPAPPYIGPPKNHGPRTNLPIKRIVIHSTVSDCKCGGARAIARYFMETDRDASAHYIVDPCEIIQGLYDSYIGYAAPPNEHELHIEMTDRPGPIPDDPPTSARYKALKRVWRWNLPNQMRMLNKTAWLTARLCLAYDVPPRFLTFTFLNENRNAKGVTTHAIVSKVWKQSVHWDPGWWPRYYFMRRVKTLYKKQKAHYDAKAA